MNNKTIYMVISVVLFAILAIHVKSNCNYPIFQGGYKLPSFCFYINTILAILAIVFLSIAL
jgi:hypothetical protein